MDSATIQLLTSGGAASVLVGLVILLLRGDLVTRKSADDRIDAIRTGFVSLVLELTTSRDEWKKIAQDSVRDVGELGEALTIRNRIDEALARKAEDLTKAGAS